MNILKDELCFKSRFSQRVDLEQKKINNKLFSLIHFREFGLKEKCLGMGYTRWCYSFINHKNIYLLILLTKWLISTLLSIFIFNLLMIKWKFTTIIWCMRYLKNDTPLLCLLSFISWVIFQMRIHFNGLRTIQHYKLTSSIFDRSWIILENQLIDSSKRSINSC